MSNKNKTTVYFDGSCPLCVKEIAIYKNRKATDVAFIDVSEHNFVPSDDLGRSQAMARFHVRKQDGTLLDGGQAFIALWAETPGFKWLASLFQTPLMVRLADLGYNQFLKIRPALQWLLGKRNQS